MEEPSSNLDQRQRLEAQDSSKSRFKRLGRFRKRIHRRLSRLHARTPYLQKVPLSVMLIIALLIFVNLVIWAICGLILTSHTHLLSTAALAYTLGLRHALDADHISAIDLMTRRLIATGQRPVTVGTFFSLGHSTIVIVTSIVVAATAAGVAGRFDSFGNVGGIIGTSVSAAFLILLGLMNAYILYKLVVQIQKVIRLQPDQEADEAWKIEGGGCLFRLLKRMFRLIDRPWKMYPLGVLFGLGFDTSSEIALLGISSIQGARGTSIWLILIFPILFTAGMCLVDTTDGALMMTLYVAPMGMGGDDKKDQVQEEPLVDQQTLTARDEPLIIEDVERAAHPHQPPLSTPTRASRVKDPLTFLYYSIVLTTLTVICAIIIGILQLLSLVLNVAKPTGPFWDGVETAGEYYEVIGGAICGSFVVFGGISVICYKPWKRWVERERARLRSEEEDEEELDVAGGYDGGPHARASSLNREGDGEGGVYGDGEEWVEVHGKSTVERTGAKAFDNGRSFGGGSVQRSGSHSAGRP